jgi:hypothetical protein
MKNEERNESGENYLNISEILLIYSNSEKQQTKDLNLISCMNCTLSVKKIFKK